MAQSSKKKAATPANTFLGLGLELAMLGIATGVASVSDEVGSIMVVFMAGLVLLWLMYHTAVTSAVPKLFDNLRGA